MGEKIQSSHAFRSETPLLRTDDDKNNHRIKRIWLQTDFRFKSYQEECSSRVV